HVLPSMRRARRFRLELLRRVRNRAQPAWPRYGMDGMTLAVEARGLGKSFGATPVLREIDFALSAGDAAFIVGRNGCGKSTMLAILAGLLAPSEGIALILGEDSRNLPARCRRRIGMLSHQSMLYPNLTALENLAFYAEIYGLDNPGASARRWIKQVQLENYASARAHTFSRGMEQRLAIARAMIADPDLLLLDEPFAALDTEGVALAAALMRSSLDRGCAIIATAHNPPEIEAMHFELLAISRGRLAPIAQSESLRQPHLRPILAG
ncbi:MAG TPA: heme ABC exporter ATP-binding protein CcmA, partial [Candidatus Binataceae bacterium]